MYKYCWRLCGWWEFGGAAVWKGHSVTYRPFPYFPLRAVMVTELSGAAVSTLLTGNPSNPQRPHGKGAVTRIFNLQRKTQRPQEVSSLAQGHTATEAELGWGWRLSDRRASVLDHQFIRFPRVPCKHPGWMLVPCTIRSCALKQR